jgi:hypothetical protein
MSTSHDAVRLKRPRTSCSRSWLRINVNQRFALKDAADAHKALEVRATSGCTILTI